MQIFAGLRSDKAIWRKESEVVAFYHTENGNQFVLNVEEVIAEYQDGSSQTTYNTLESKLSFSLVHHIMTVTCTSVFVCTDQDSSWSALPTYYGHAQSHECI